MTLFTTPAFDTSLTVPSIVAASPSLPAPLIGGTRAGSLGNGMRFDELVSASESWDADLMEVPLLPQVKFNAEGLVHEGKTIPVDDAARERLYGILNAPEWYLKKLSPELQAAVLSGRPSKPGFGSRPIAMLQKGELYTIADGDFGRLSMPKVLRSMQDGVGADMESLRVIKVDYAPDRLEIELASDARAITVRQGDVLQSGLSIIYEPFSNRAFEIRIYVFRCVCSNGLIRKECVAEDVISRYRRQPIEAANALDLQRDQIRRLTAHNWTAVQAQLDAMKKTSEQRVDVEKLLTRWLDRAKISVKNMRPKLMEAWRREGDEATVYGAVNAISYVGTHDTGLTRRQRRVLSSLAGMLAFSEKHYCEKCLAALGRESNDSRAA